MPNDSAFSQCNLTIVLLYANAEQGFELEKETLSSIDTFVFALAQCHGLLYEYH